jgi:hypothetical protein
VGRAIEAAWRAGARFDAWGEHFDFARWETAFAEAGLSIADYANCALGTEERLPWDHIMAGPPKAALRAEAEQARSPAPAGRGPEGEG